MRYFSEFFLLKEVSFCKCTCFWFLSRLFQKVVCSEIKEHARQMLVFVTQFKAMLYSIGLDSTSQLDEFFKNNAPTTFFTATSRFLNSLEYDGKETFTQFAPSCGCSDNNPNPKIFPELNVRDAKGQAFCFHRALNPGLLGLFDRLRSFLSQQIYAIYSQKELDVFNQKIHSANHFKTLTNYQPCVCLKVAHNVSDFHDMRFPKMFFTSDALSLKICE